MAVVALVVLMCAALGVYSFLQLNAAGKQEDFNLFSLVPDDAIAVLQTEHMADLVDEVNNLQCSQDNHFLYISDLVVYLKKHLYTLLNDTPHGLSRQMNKMLISFHEPDVPANQVLYCCLSEDDHDLVESFIQKYGSSRFPVKLFDYKGCDIRIYPMADGRFLAAYFTSDFLVLSFQKRLVERVIDTMRSRHSLMSLPDFKEMYDAGVPHNAPATVYLHMKSVDMGSERDSMTCSQALLGGWTEYAMHFKEDAVYCSGQCHGQDSLPTFANALRGQEMLHSFRGDKLPASTFFYNTFSFSDKPAAARFVRTQQCEALLQEEETLQNDELLMNFLADYGGEQITSCLFLDSDTMNTLPCAVLALSLTDEWNATRQLPAVRYNHQQGYCRLPSNTLLARATGIAGYAQSTYACFYGGELLMAPDTRSLQAYVDAMERNDVLDGNPLYEKTISSLSPTYGFMMLADVERIMQQPDTYVRLLPRFFLRHAPFFRHFTLAIQFTCADGVVYPNVVLLYKGDEQQAADA